MKKIILGAVFALVSVTALSSFTLELDKVKANSFDKMVCIPFETSCGTGGVACGSSTAIIIGLVLEEDEYQCG